MSNNLWLLILVAFAVASSSTALKCVTCADCENRTPSNVTCSKGFNQCLKVHLHDKVRKLCAPSLACKLEEVDRKSLNPAKNMKLFFNDADWNKLVGGSKKLLHCCDTDLCNGAPDTKTSLGLLFMLPVTLYYLVC